MKVLNWHIFVYKVFRIILMPFLKRKFNYCFEKVSPINYPYFVVSNHTTDYDSLLVGLAFPKQMYYVASDHIFRWGFVSKVITFLVAPIPRIKGSTEVQTVIQIFKKIKAGANVCIFAEGDSSFNGETGTIPDSTGKLIKRSGAALITYRLDGGYFSSPRWSRTLRRGLMSGRIVREYSPKEIKAMTADELNRVIQNDLYVNAYEEQKNRPINYYGKKLAENLETALYLCPCCGGIATLKSEDDKFYCACGLNLRYTLQGLLMSQDGNPPPFETVLDWSKWQSLKVAEQTNHFKESSGYIPILTDVGQSLWRVERASKSKLVGEGTLRLFCNRLVLDCENGTQHAFNLGMISDLAIHGQMVLIFSTTNRESYEIKSNFPRSALKYLEYYRVLKDRLRIIKQTEE